MVIDVDLLFLASCGRNFVELLRVVDSLQLSEQKRVTTPANWKVGDEGKKDYRAPSFNF
jgi:alkyl hydroperoxide reductase subunit AhpC